jgi:hypothetical protein
MSTHETIDQLFTKLKSKWDIKDLGSPKRLVGINIETSNEKNAQH